MSQHPTMTTPVTGTVTGLELSQTLNAIAAALASNNSGPTAPPVTFPYMWWPDTTSGLLKQRNGADTAWNIIGPLSDLGIRSGSQNVAIAAGAADALTGDFTPDLSDADLVQGMRLYVRAAYVNTTTTPTFQADSSTARTIVKGAGIALEAGDIAGANHWLELMVDNTSGKYVLINPARGQSAAIAKTDKTQTFTAAQISGATALTSGTAWNANAIQHATVNVNGSSFTIANPSAATDCEYIAIFVKYTTSHSIAWGSNFKGVVNISPSATAGKYDNFLFRYDATTGYFMCVGYALDVGA